jgi:hypothetical protein
MSIRKRSDSDDYIDGNKGSNYSRQDAVDPWTVKPAAGPREKAYTPFYESGDGTGAVERLHRSNSGKFVDGDLTPKFDRRDDYQFREGKRDLWEAVEGQSSDSGNRAVNSRGQ